MKVQYNELSIIISHTSYAAWGTTELKGKFQTGYLPFNHSQITKEQLVTVTAEDMWRTSWARTLSTTFRKTSLNIASTHKT